MQGARHRLVSQTNKISTKKLDLFFDVDKIVAIPSLSNFEDRLAATQSVTATVGLRWRPWNPGSRLSAAFDQGGPNNV